VPDNYIKFNLIILISQKVDEHFSLFSVKISRKLGSDFLVIFRENMVHNTVAPMTYHYQYVCRIGETKHRFLPGYNHTMIGYKKISV